jgi:hypothetical protein
MGWIRLIESSASASVDAIAMPIPQEVAARSIWLSGSHIDMPDGWRWPEIKHHGRESITMSEAAWIEISVRARTFLPFAERLSAVSRKCAWRRRGAWHDSCFRPFPIHIRAWNRSSRD